MSTTTRTTWLTALAVLLTSSSLVPVFEDLGWLLPVASAVGAVALAGLAARRLRIPALLQPLLGVLAVGLLAAVLSAAETLTGGLLPGRATVVALGTRLGEGLLDVEQLTPPVPSTPGLVLLTLLGVGAVAVVADLLAVGLRRPALAGLPLLTLLVVPAATIDGGVGVAPFALGAVGWLGLLMADNGDRVGRWGSALRSVSPRGGVRKDDTSLGRVGRRIGVAALGTALVVPALVPGLESSLIDGGGGNGLGGARTTTTYNPLTELGGQLRLPDPRPLLAYSTTDPSPDYLRLTTLDVFDDDAGWSSSELSADVERDAVERGIPAPAGSSSADVQPLTTRILVQQLDGPWLPVPPVPSTVEVEGRWLWDAESQTVFSTRTSLQEVEDSYRVTAERVVPSVERLRRGGVLPADVERLAVPPEVSEYVREQTALAVGEAATPYEQAAALQAFFRDGNRFSYSEDASVPGIDGPNALERFLRGGQGFCEQYASAMAAMARLLGLPARVGVGFTPGTPQDDGTYQVTTSDAHAWPEIWFAGHGWLRFEPTPRTDQVVTPGYTVAPAPGAEFETGAVEPTQAPAAPVDPQDPQSAAERERQLAEDGLAAPAPGDDGPGAALLRVARVVLLAALVLAVPAVVAALRRRRRWATPGPEAAWAQVREDAVDVGAPARRSESPRAYAARLAAERPLTGAPAQALQRLAAAVERARYARPADGGADDASALHADVATVRGALHATAGTRARWAARLAPPSTLRWMVTASGTAVADGLDRLDELVSSSGGRLRGLLTRRPRSA